MLKVAVIGGGSTYTPELITGFMERITRFPLDELWLMDIDEDRLNIVGGFAQRIVAAQGSPFNVVLTTDQRAAVDGASYVLTQLRVGQMPARREDEYLGRRHGLIGQETTGVGGMAKALRTIPIILNIAADMRQLAPDALLVNFTNPAGLVTQALAEYAPDIAAVGVCNAPITTRMEITKELKKETGQSIAPERAHLETLGLNHLSWHRGFTLDGEDIWSHVLDSYIVRLREEEVPKIPPHVVESLGMIPNYYLEYFYQTDHKLAEQANWPPSRADEVMEIEEALLVEYADPNRTEPPEDLMKRGGAYYSTLATQLLDSHYNDLGEVHVVNVPNRGAVADWPDEWVLELPCKVFRRGIEPIPAEPLPSSVFGLLSAVKSYELSTVQAAVYGDRDAAIQALLVHPLGPPADLVQTVLDDMLEIHRPYLPQFWQDA